MSTRAVVDDAGTVLGTFDYYPGGLHMPQRTSTTGNTIEKFTGKGRDESLGLDYFGTCYYDPASWRWHNVDPPAILHTNDAPSVIARLLDMGGIEPFFSGLVAAVGHGPVTDAQGV